jgi:hypothetical protein
VYPTGSAYAHAGFGLDWSGNPLQLQDNEARKLFCISDFRRSISSLEVILGQDCPYLCLPWGQYNIDTISTALQAGFISTLTLDREFTGRGSNSQRIGRLAVKDKKSIFWLIFKILQLAFRPTSKFRTPL